MAFHIAKDRLSHCKTPCLGVRLMPFRNAIKHKTQNITIGKDVIVIWNRLFEGVFELSVEHFLNNKMLLRIDGPAHLMPDGNKVLYVSRRWIGAFHQHVAHGNNEQRVLGERLCEPLKCHTFFNYLRHPSHSPESIEI